MCRYPSSSAHRTALTHSGPLGTCQTPRPSIGISLSSASRRARPSAVTRLVVKSVSFGRPGLPDHTNGNAAWIPLEVPGEAEVGRLSRAYARERTNVGGQVDNRQTGLLVSRSDADLEPVCDLSRFPGAHRRFGALG